MKKNSLCFLFLSSLIMTGCGGTTSEPEEIKKPDYTGLFNLVNPTDTCLVNAKVKDYTDGMYAQREAAGVEPQNEVRIVDPLYAETTKVSKFRGDYDESIPVELSFTVDESIKDDGFIIKYWVGDNEDQAKEVEPVDGKVTLVNLFRSSTYNWQVISKADEDKVSKIESFTTGDYIRFLNCGGAYNVRDNGGWTTVDGKRIKQGMVYRGAELNDHRLTTNNHAQNIFGDDDPAKKIFVDDFGIRAEVDLRSATEADNITKCCMNTADVAEDDPRYVAYARPNITSYIDGLNKPADQANIKIIFDEYLANADEKPVYYHCYGGADRTGTIAFLLGSILGMTYTDLVIDFEATTFSNNLKEHDRDSDKYTHFPEMIAGIKAWSFYSDSKPLSEVMETYLTQTCGVAQASIDKIREIMLEDID